jgi:hypothetical protein
MTHGHFWQLEVFAVGMDTDYIVVEEAAFVAE